MDNRPALTIETRQKRLVKKLKKADATLYGSKSCQFTERQKQIFGEQIENLRVVLCDGQLDDQGKWSVQECKDRKIKGYPTMVIKNPLAGQPMQKPFHKIEGYRSLIELEDIVKRRIKMKLNNTFYVKLVFCVMST